MTAQKNVIDLLDIVVETGWNESDTIEFKSAKGGLPQSLWPTYSAFANTKGGIILLGVENNGTVSGLIDIDKIKKSFWDTINNRSKVSCNLVLNDDFKIINHVDGQLIAIQVRRASHRDRPVFVDQNPLTGTYKRNYEGDYRCNEQEVMRMLADKSEESADNRILEHYKMEDLDFQSLQQYRQRFASHKPTHPWLSENDLGLLTKLGGWRVCKKTGKEGPTLAGMLMFGKEEALCEALGSYQVDYREKLSDDPAVRWTDRITLDGTWPGNLFQFYIRVVQKLSADLKLPFQLDVELYRKGETVIHEAIREALVNALIHADYTGHGGVVIDKYKNRFELSNPGVLLVSMEQLLRGNVSVCRNQSLQKMFTSIGAAEKAGSGVDKIRQGWNSQHWRSPNIEERVQPDRVFLTLPMISLIPEESQARLKSQFGNQFEKFAPLEIQALVTADLEGEVTNARMRQVTSEHPTDITKLLQRLVAEGFLMQDGQGRGTRYRLPRVSNSAHIAGDSTHIAGDSTHIAGDSTHIAGDSTHKDSEIVTKTIDNQLEALIGMADPAKFKRRMMPQELQNIILTLCEKNWLTGRQLGDLLGRNAKGIRSRLLMPMVKSGLLRLKHPEKPNHVDQAYLTNKS